MKNRKYKKSMVLGIILLFIGASIVPSISSVIDGEFKFKGVEKNIATQSKATRLDQKSHYLSLHHERADFSSQQTTVLNGGSVVTSPGNQLHPAFGRNEAGSLMAAYYDEDMNTIIWMGSNNDGSTFSEGRYWNVEGDYPSVKLWEGSRFFGTFVVDPDSSYDGYMLLFECTNPMDNTTYSVFGWDWSSAGLYDMIDADIACDDSNNSWEWGFSSYVMSSTADRGFTNGPVILYADPEDGDYAYMSWYEDYDGCAHTDIDIDPVTHLMYAVYDWYNTSSQKWELLVWVKDFLDSVSGYEEVITISGNGNLQYPTVAAYDDNLVILTETDENGDKDVICYYSDDGINGLSTGIVINTVNDERYPDVRHDSGDDFICTFVNGVNLYGSQTDNGGQTWNYKTKINDNSDAVVEEYKTSDICENAKKVMWEELHDDVDIYINDIDLNYPPYTPDNPSPADDATGVSITADLSWTGGDPDDDTVYYDVYFEADDPTPDDLVSDDQTSTSYNPVTMNYNTHYYWRIEAYDEHGEPADPQGSIWDFITTEGPSNYPPTFSNENPSDGTTDVPIVTSSLSVFIEDPEGDSFDWSITTSPNVGSSSGTGESNGTKTCAISGLSYSTTYTWTVSATDSDGGGETTTEIYTFTTKVNNSPVFSNEIPSDGSTDIPLATSSLSVIIEDPEGDSFDWSITTSPNIGSSSGTGENNGTKICSISGLSYGMTYSWTVNAIDPSGSGEITSETYTFTTEVNLSPVFSNEIPSDGSQDVNITTSSLSINISDPEGDSFDWSITTSPNIGSSSGAGENNGTKTCTISGLNYSSIYTWSVSATDPGGGGGTTSETYTFTTEPPPNSPPYEPSNPNPENGEINVPLNVVLNWTGGDPDNDTVTYDIYFGITSPPPKIIGNQSATIYDPGTINHNTMYYWQIIAGDSHNVSTAGPIWNFTTKKENLPPTITITKPKKGIYVNDLIRREAIFLTLVIQSVTIEVNATDQDDGIERVEFYIDRELKKTVTALGNDTYSMLWDERSFIKHRHIIEVKAYDYAGQKDTDRVIAWKFF